MQKRMWAAALAGIVVLSGLAIERPMTGAARYPLQEHDAVRRTFRVPSGADRRIEVSNLSGRVTVTAGGSDRVEVVIERMLHAADASAMNEARRVSQPAISEGEQGLRVLAAGRLLGACDERRDDTAGSQWSPPTYRVEARVEIRTLANVDVRVCTINGGTTVTGITGTVTVSAVNGPIEVRDISSAVSIKTVNGSITAGARSQPVRDWDLQTVNGNVTLRLPAGADADVLMKVLHGGIFTDFETASLPSPAIAVERGGDMRVYRSNRSIGARIGKGGPKLAIETVNGNISVQRR